VSPGDEQQTDTSVAGRRALLEVVAALTLSVVLLAAMLAAVLFADRDIVAGLGVLALATAVGVSTLVARRISRTSVARSEALEQERRGREQLDRTLAATRGLVEIDSPLELRRQICEVARDVFECSGVSLWAVEDDHLRLLERAPWVNPYTGGDRRAIAELPGLAEALRTARPLFVEDMRTAATGMTQATAEIVGTGSLLNVPVASAGVVLLDLVLSWDTQLPAPSEARLIAAQRYADQAGLALEQSSNRTAQAEIASLNRTLGRMVQTDPLFRADGTVEEVAHAICTEALAVFEAGAAAVWVDAGEAIQLLWREPEAEALPRHQRILLSEHPQFGEDLEAGHPHFLADVEQDDPVLWERFARQSGSRSQLRLPLASGGHARALIVLSWADPVPPPSAEVSAIASRFADQAGVALAEAARREAQREATDLHARFAQSLLPSISLASPGVGLATLYRPGDERLSLGGDFYDCLELADGSIAMLIGDVAGHGAAAAALGAGLRSAWRALVLAGLPPSRLPGGMQEVWVRERQDPYLFVTTITALIEPDRSCVHFVSAGHPAPLILGTRQAAGVPNGPPLGIVSAARWETATVALPPRATVLLYTDGLVEGRARPGASERLGIGPLDELLAAATPGAVTQQDLRGLVALATERHGSGLPDDVALLALNLAPV
jgi:serine phosphatase RsbU (regulator of sigma subunit)